MPEYEIHSIYADTPPYHMRAQNIDKLRKRLFANLTGTGDAPEVYIISKNGKRKHLGKFEMMRSVVDPRAYWNANGKISRVSGTTGRTL